MNYESLRKYKVGIYIKFHHMLRGKIFEKKAKNHLGGQNPPPSPVRDRGLKGKSSHGNRAYAHNEKKAKKVGDKN